MTHSIKIPISSLSPWSIPDGTLEALDSEKLKFRFIIGDRGDIYDIRANIDLFACTNWYWEFRVYILKNFKLVHREHYFRVPTIVASDIPNMVGTAERCLKDVFIRKVITDAIQPSDFYK